MTRASHLIRSLEAQSGKQLPYVRKFYNAAALLDTGATTGTADNFINFLEQQSGEEIAGLREFNDSMQLAGGAKKNKKRHSTLRKSRKPRRR